jgi:hypothetical protein
VGPDRLKALEQQDAWGARIIRLAKDYVLWKKASEVKALTTEELRGKAQARNKAEDAFTALDAALAGEEVNQGSLIDG